MKILDILDTPNPNARKILLDSAVAVQTKSYFNAAAAKDDPLAMKLFAIPGVSGVMLLGSFITVSKRAEAPWPAILSELEKVLAT